MFCTSSKHEDYSSMKLDVSTNPDGGQVWKIFIIKVSTENIIYNHTNAHKHT